VTLGFRKTLKRASDVRLNVNRRGVEVSAGPRGAKMSVLSSGRRRASLGWRGLFWRRQI
jgi:hypothetical protein